MTRVVQAVLAREPGADIVIDTSVVSRPWFRFGSGRWGRAECKVKIKSKKTGRSFDVYMLPQMTQEPSSVPILVGMSHLGPNRAIQDLGSGDMVYANIPERKPTRMIKNSKGLI